MKELTLDLEIFTRVVEDIVTREECRERLKGGRQLRVKLGIDATAPELHSGRGVKK